MRVGSTFSTMIINKLLILIINIFSYLLFCKKIIPRTNNKRANTPGTGGTVVLVPTIGVQMYNLQMMSSWQAASVSLRPLSYCQPKCAVARTASSLISPVTALSLRQNSWLHIRLHHLQAPIQHAISLAKYAPWYNLHSLPPYIQPSIPPPTHRQPLSRKPHWPILHSSPFPL